MVTTMKQSKLEHGVLLTNRCIIVAKWWTQSDQDAWTGVKAGRPELDMLHGAMSGVDGTLFEKEI